MDTRQLAAFCAVVERKSFSQAAERLGVTQPAVSLQVRALEKRLGTQLLDRSGRRVEPTEAGRRLYRGAQRLLPLEEQLLEDIADGDEGELTGTLELGASTGPGAIVLPLLLCEFQPRHPGVKSRSRSPTRTRSSSTSPPASSSSASSAQRAASAAVAFEPFFRDEVSSPCPPGHPFAGRTVTLDELRDEPLIVMQEGAGVRQVIEDELRRRGDAAARPRRAGSSSACRSPCESAVLAGYGVTFISRSAVETELAAGRLGDGARRGLNLAREISLVRAAGAADPGRRRLRRVRARASSRRDRPLGARRAARTCSPSSASSARCSSRAPRWRRRSISGRRSAGRRCRRDRIGGGRERAGRTALVAVGGGSAIDTAKALVRRDGPAARLRADDLLRRRVDDRSSACATRPEDEGRRRRGARWRGIVYEPRADARRCRAAETVGTAMNALAHSAEALYVDGRNAEGDEDALAGRG